MRLRLLSVSLLWVTLCGALLSLGCGDDDSGPVDSGELSDASGDTHADDAGDASDAAEPDAGDAGPTEEEVALRALLEDALPTAPEGIEGISLVVHDANDRRVLEITVGDFEVTRRVPIASASKLITGLVLLRLIDADALSFEDTPRSVLSWRRGAADATLDHLGAFTSGLRAESLCLFDHTRNLQPCVELLELSPALNVPGARFEYGSTHQAVAAAMAEVATGQRWDALFEREIKTPLGLTDPGLRYYTNPKQELGDNNPLVAGGLTSTTDEYLEMLSVLFHRGTYRGERLIEEATIDRMGDNLYPDATFVGPGAAAGLGYSWCSWIACEGQMDCQFITSPGAFGYTPWVDRDAGYYAVLAMEADALDSGGTAFSVARMVEVRPLIEAFVARER